MTQASVATAPNTSALLRVRAEFPVFSHTIDEYPLAYLDSAATTQKPKCVIDAMSEFYENDNANVKRGMHVLAERSTEIYEGARERVRKFVNARRCREIIFTKNATEGINLVARSLGETHLRKGDIVLLTLLEHHSNIVPWLQLKEKIGIEIGWIGIQKDGTLRWDEAEKILKTGRVKLVCMTAVSNVLGVKTPYTYYTHIIHMHGARLLLDAAQLAAHSPIDVQEIDCDFLVFSGHKVYGPTGIGVLYGKEELLKGMPPFLGGGTMIQEVFTDRFTPANLPEKFEAGTPPIAEARGLHVALVWLEGLGWKNIQMHEKELMSYALRQLGELDFVEILGPKDPEKVTGCISFLCPAKPEGRSGVHPHDLTEYCGRKGVCLRAGHHCCQPLHDFLGIPATTRMSVGVYNTKEDVDRACEAVREAYRFFTRST
jgi:cysteine desulfurase / selenocysteine lyase